MYTRGLLNVKVVTTHDRHKNRKVRKVGYEGFLVKGKNNLF